MTLKSKLVVAFVVCISATFIACESKFSESSPSNVAIKGKNLEQRLKLKNESDARITEIQTNLKNTKAILELFNENIQRQSPTENNNTPIDFLLEANDKLIEKIPEEIEKKLIRTAKVEAPPFQWLSDDCRTFETKLEFENMDEDSSSPGGERMTYLLKPCGTKTEFLEVFVAEWIGKTLNFNIVNKNIETILKDATSNLLENSFCTIVQDEKNTPESIHCKHFYLELSKTETAHITNIISNQNGAIKYEVLADIIKNEKVNETLVLRIKDNGEKDIDIKEAEGSQANIQQVKE